MKITFFGAAGTVTGSCYLLTSDKGKSILIDLGMFQGADEITKLNYEPLGFDPSTLAGVLLTHAHLDHCGRLPLLVMKGYEGKIYMTEATKMLTQLVLLDAAMVAMENREHEPMYTDANVHLLFPHIETITYDTTFTVGDFSVTFRNAGHILGSASIEIRDMSKENGEKIVFSGDLGNTPEPLQQPTESISHADIVIMEATYGDRTHPAEDIPEVVRTEIASVEHSGGVLLIPAFSIDRTQELLYIIEQLKKEEKISRNIPIFLDSPMAIKVTEVYEEFRDNLSDDIVKLKGDPFVFPGLTMTASVEDSKKILRVPGAKVIIAGNGMMSGGRIWHHLINYLPLATTRLLIVGFQGDETLGKAILDGAKRVMIHGQEIDVNATVTDVPGLSAHADQPKLLAWLKKIQGVKKVFLTHGEDGARNILSQKIKEELHMEHIILPIKGDEETPG